MAFIRSEATALAVVDTYNLATAAFIRDNRPGTFSLASWLGLHAEAADLSKRETAAQILQQGLRVARFSRESQIDVTFVSGDPETARVVADGVVGIFLKAEAGLTGPMSQPAEIVQRAAPRRSSDASVWALGLLLGIALAVLCSMAASVVGILRRTPDPGQQRLATWWCVVRSAQVAWPHDFSQRASARHALFYSAED